jgi:hypothetical protein
MLSYEGKFICRTYNPGLQVGVFPLPPCFIYYRRIKKVRDKK